MKWLSIQLATLALVLLSTTTLVIHVNAAIPPYTPPISPIVYREPLIVFNTSLKLKKPPPIGNLKVQFVQLAVAPTGVNFRPAVVNATKAALAGINTALQNAGKPKLDAKYTPEAFADAAIAAMGGKPSLSKRNLHTRDIFTDIACWAFATGALPGFLVAAAWFAGANTGTPYTATSDDESFFLKAIYGTPPSHKVYYSATFPPGFGSAAATTIGHHVYFKDGAAHNDNPAAGKWSLNAAFADRTHILAHESRHIQQFESDGSLLAFGYNYLYEYCQAGFSYSKNSYEKEAYQVGDSVLPLMSPPIFYKIWKGVALQPKIGWPTSTTSTNGIIYFTNGFLQINPSDFPNNVSTKRYRFATKGTDAYKRFVGAQCNPNRKPLNGNSKPCKSDNAPAACDPEYIDALNKACKANIQALANNPIGWLTF